MVLDEVSRRYRQYMSDDAFEALPSGGPRWIKHVYWQKFNLARLGFMDSPSPRLWRITEEGLRWLRDNPDSTVIDVGPGQTKAPRERRGRAAREPRRSKNTPAQDEQGRWLEIIDREVRSVREFLQGRAVRPSDERLCDLVQLCYLLELYREACDLFALIDSSGVNPWLYARTSKLARICAAKVGR